ncbi:hypothetical protein BUALT_BualtUnG0006400 [Buddleja alternifolia]|uniref:Peptidase M14 domain-containing protein n=1 Tax=Buddleja alternifolia TaxID=168488 RepID=A0AAV6W7Q6_9LAMI|nr:hypothetical protein BUALT_BualtUnG0006400 [Buddleja alternifolia]
MFGYIGDGNGGSTRTLFAEDGFQMSEEDYLRKLLFLSLRDFGFLISIGKSVRGSPLWVMEVSDKPGQKVAEPAFKFIGNVLGDEPVGHELLLLLANWICDNYMKDPLATLIVDNVHLHMLPSMKALRRRGNANNIDLNRDFPDQFFPMNDDVDLRQPETKAIMNWLDEMRFTASASLHRLLLSHSLSSKLVKERLLQIIHGMERKIERKITMDALMMRHSDIWPVYTAHRTIMSVSKEFPGGITNGAFWYPIYGGMQDWNFIHYGCFELTLEISDNKWPNAS